MKTACKKNIEVFDFEEEAEVPEIALRIKSKLENSKNAIDKYTFLATGIDAININQVAIPLIEEDVSPTKTMPDSNQAVKIAEQHCQSSPPPSNSKRNSAILDPLPSDEAADMNPDENRSMSARSSSTSTDVADGVFAGPSSDHCMGGREMESQDNEDNTTVVFYPDYMAYCDSYYTDSVLTFTSSFIEMEGSTADANDQIFKFKWGIKDILHIKSHWYEWVEMAMVKIHVLSKDTAQTENFECASGTELRFSVVGPSWYGSQEAIASLNVMYKALWSSVLEPEDDVLGHTRASFTNYFPDFDPPFKEVIYPKGDADAVSISKRDFDLLQPDTFLNDTIIDFYIKYLKNKLKPDDRHRFHFFNCFFFRKLADPDKDPLDASEGRVAFQRVKKWTRKVNLFEKDYVFIPVNYNYHWSLLVMCHLGDVAAYQDEDVSESIKVPCILHMDSLRGSHTGLKGLVQSYLKEEWKERHHDASEDISSRFDDLRCISLELPQQQNLFDCGLFLLHFVELFLEQAPVHFNPFKITKSSNFLNVDWFSPADASLKRVVIQKLIYGLLHDGSQEPPTTNGDEHHNSSHPTTLIHEDEPSVALQPTFERGSFVGTPFTDFDQMANLVDYKGSLAPVEEDVEGCGLYVCLPTETEFHQCKESTPDASACGRSLVIPHHESENDNYRSSVSGSEDSIEIVNENSQLNEKTEQPRSPSPSPGLSSPLDTPPGLSSRFSGTKNVHTGSTDASSGSEPDVQNPTKKARMTEPQKKLCGVDS